MHCLQKVHRTQGGKDLIEVKNLVKKYGNHLAIDHLDFKIEKGKIYGFWVQMEQESQQR